MNTYELYTRADWGLLSQTLHLLNLEMVMPPWGEGGRNKCDVNRLRRVHVSRLKYYRDTTT